LKPQRGLTFVAVLFYLAIASGIWWVATFGPAYWENQEVKSTLHEAANLCYHERNDEEVRKFILKRLQSMFEVPGARGQSAMSIDLDPGDLRVERTQSPKHVNIWLTYSRTVKTPFINQERSVTFTDFAEQDLNDVKW
jgi:hypothetical protein